jgi:hypothetical protein
MYSPPASPASRREVLLRPFSKPAACSYQMESFFTEDYTVGICLLVFGAPLLLGLLIWGVFTPPKPKPADYVESSKWTWVTLAFLFLVVMWYSR